MFRNDKNQCVIYLEHQYPQSDLDDLYPRKTFGQKCIYIYIYIYIYESVFVQIKDTT
jgi:hypothetical protein